MAERRPDVSVAVYGGRNVMRIDQYAMVAIEIG